MFDQYCYLFFQIPIEKLLENSKRMSCKKKTRSSAVLKNFADLPDRCILQILEKLKYSDICNLRLVDRRLNLIIQVKFFFFISLFMCSVIILSNVMSMDMSTNLNFYFI